MTKKKTTEIRRDEIINASLRLIEKDGLDNLSVADIAAEIDLVPSAIYRHFGGKEEIINTLIDFVDRSLQANAASVAGSSHNAVKKLELLYRLHTDFLKTQPAIPRIVFSLLAGNKNPALKKRIVSVIADYVSQVQHLVAQGQADGDIVAAIDSAAAAMLFIGMMQPLIILSQTDDRSVDVFKQEMWAVYARGIRN